jgi:hypothetical protein
MATTRRVYNLLLTNPSMFLSETFHFYGICRKNKSRRADSNRLSLLFYECAVSGC